MGCKHFRFRIKGTEPRQPPSATCIDCGKVILMDESNNALLYEVYKMLSEIVDPPRIDAEID